MVTTQRAVIVEGKYDKIRLSSVVDALIVTTEGFGIFSDREKQRFIKMTGKRTLCCRTFQRTITIIFYLPVLFRNQINKKKLSTFAGSGFLLSVQGNNLCPLIKPGYEPT